MVAIRSHEADRFIARDLGSFAAFLVFGPDSGLVSERSGLIVRAMVDDPKDPFQLVRLDGDAIARDPPRLADEAETVPLFGGRRAVLVEVGSRPIVSAVERALDSRLACPMIFEAGALKSDSTLRRAFEGARRAAAIECLPDEARDIVRLIDAEAAAAGMTIEADARELLTTLLGADRRASRSEIEKLILYAHGRATITLDDVEAAVADASALAAEAAIDAAFAGDLAGLDAALERLDPNALEAGTLMMAALRHAILLHRNKTGGGPANYALRGLSPRRKAAFERQLAGLTSDFLGRMIARLGEAIGEGRREPRLAEQIAARALWGVAHGARPRRVAAQHRR